MPIGRPSGFTQELANTICLRLSEGESLREICRDPAMPSTSMVMRWANDMEDFREQYAKAREALLEHWAEEITEIADDGSNDYMERRNEDGSLKDILVDHEHIARSRLRVDTRKWLLSKLAAKKYGDRVDHTHGSPAGGPVEMRITFVNPGQP